MKKSFLFSLLAALTLWMGSISAFAGTVGVDASAASIASSGVIINQGSQVMPQNFALTSAGFAQLLDAIGRKPTYPQELSALVMAKHPVYMMRDEDTRNYHRTDVTYALGSVDDAAQALGVKKKYDDGKLHLPPVCSFGQKVKGIVIGTYQLTADPGKANSVNLNTFFWNVQHLAAEDFEGWDICLVSIPDFVSLSFTMKSGSNSASVGSSLSSLNPIGLGLNVLGGIGLGFSSSKGLSVTGGQLGDTFFAVLRVADDSPVGEDIDIAKDYVDLLVQNAKQEQNIKDAVANDADAAAAAAAAKITVKKIQK